MKKAIVVLVSMMLLGTLLWQCERGVAPVSSTMKKELSRLPESAIGLAYVNVSKIRQSDFFGMYEDEFQTKLSRDKDYQNFAEATGFDLTKDVDEMFIIFAPGQTRSVNKFLAVIKGNFDEDRIIGFVSTKDRQHELKSKSHGDYTVYRVEDKPVRFSFPDETTLIVGVEEYVTSWLDGDKSTDKWIERMAKMRYRNGICATMDAKAMINDIMLEVNEWDQGKKLQALKSVEDVYFSMEATDVIQFEGRGKFTDAQNAELFHDAIKGMIATVKISVSGDREAVDVFNKIKINQDGDWVTGQFKMSKEDIEKLLKTRPEALVL
jgi:hypothetical protein